MRARIRIIAIVMAASLLLGLTVSCDEERTEMKFDAEQYAAAAGDPVQLRFVAEERRNTGCMLNAQETRQVDQTQHIDGWSVEPASGATIDASGRFTATEPGQYTITATFSGNAYTTRVVVDEEGGATVEEPVEAEPAEEAPALDALAGDWSWTGAMDDNGVLGPSSSAYTYTFRQEGGGYALYVEDTRLCDVSFDGTNVSFSGSLMGTYEYNGVLSGDTITGTQNHEGGRWVGPWNATRVR